MQGPEQVVVGATFSRRELATGLSVAVRGELDLANAGELERALMEAGTVSPIVLLDLGGITFIDCAALGALIRTAQALAAAGSRLVVLDGSEPFRRLVNLAGTRQSLEIVDPADVTP